MLLILSEMHLKTRPEPGLFEYTKPMIWHHPLVGQQQVDKGRTTDFASIPPFFRRIFNVNGKHREEAGVHDDLYRRRGVFDTPNGQIKLTRKQCDQIFLDGLTYDGIPWWKRQLMHKAVRVFGGYHLRKTSGRGWDD